jgi:tetratricopeptide (TPR) repeat protein
LGEVSAARGRLGEAIEYYIRAIEIIPQPEFLGALGDLYSIQGEHTLARRQYEMVELIGNLDPINRRVYNRQLANFYSDHDLRPEEALRLALRELEVRKDVFGYDAAAWAYYKNGRLEEAQEMINEAMELGTRDATLHYHAGMIAFARGELAAAKRLLSEALAINPFFDPLQAQAAGATLESLSGQIAATDLRRPR